ncbi:MAG TPA: hypothetical protein VEQ65_03025, partial [Opitutus sp.]|nr:hypothetical protein [Opitutus sp.]
MKILPLVLMGLASSCAALAVERATYNSAGGLTSLIVNGADVPISGHFEVNFGDGVRASLQPHDQRSPIWRQGTELRWRGVSTFANGGQAQFEAAWTESDDAVVLAGSITSGGPPPPGAPAGAGPRWPLFVESVDYVIDLPREFFVGGRVAPHNLPLTPTQPATPVFFNDTTAHLAVANARGNWTLDLALDAPRLVTLADRWEGNERSYQLRIRLAEGAWPQGDVRQLGLTLKLTGQPDAAPARLVVDPSVKRYAFDGFGGNYCFNTQTPAVDYLMENLQHAWARFELKGALWDRERDRPGPQLVRDFELMQRVQQKGLPWIISLWRLPERYYADPNQRPAGSFNRKIAADRWPEFLDLIGSY